MNLENSVWQDGYPEKIGETTYGWRRPRRVTAFAPGPSRYLSVRSGNVLWFSSQVMVAGGLEVTTQENLATEPSVTSTGAGCNTNSEIPAEDEPPAVTEGCLNQQ